MEVLISMPSPVVRFNNTGFQAEMRLETAYIYCTYHAKIWGLFSFSIIGALVVGFWTCTAWPLANFPFPCPVVFSAFFFLLFSLIQKERPKWLACMPCQINMGIPVMRAGLALPGRDLSCPRPFAAVLLSMTRLGMWYHSTSLFNFADSLQDTSIYLTINLQIFPMMASSLLRGPESNCRVCTLYAEWGMARFWFTRFTSWHLRFQGLPTTTKLTGDWGDHTETFYTYNQLKCRCCLLFSCTGK